MERSFGRINLASRASMLVGIAALSAVAVAQPVGVNVVQGDYYTQQLVVFAGSTGDVAFDPMDGNQIYLTRDDTAVSGGGIYRLSAVNGVLQRERFVLFSNPSGLVFTADGDLWITNDWNASLDVVRAPRNGAPYTVEQLIDNYQTASDDDPLAIGLAPAGFDGTFVDPGDLVIADRGADGNPFNDFYVYTPNSLPGGSGSPTDPAAYSNFLASVFTLGAYNDNDLNDFDFASDGLSIFAVFRQGQVVELDSDGNVLGEVAVSGVTFSHLQAIAVNPLDGRLWVADDDLDAIWSVHATTGVAQQELVFSRSGQVAPNAIDFQEPSLRFTSDGQTLVVSDRGSPGYMWVLERIVAGGNNPPAASIATVPANGEVALVGGVGTLTLDGTGSSDGDGGSQGLTYAWTQVDGPSARIASPNAATTEVMLPSGGNYIFALKVDDGQATENVAVAQVWVIVPGVGAKLDADTFACARVASFPGFPGDVAFDPTDNDTMYVIDDSSMANTGGIYRLDPTSTNSFVPGDQIEIADYPAGMAFTADGDLWYVRDGSAGTGAHLIRVTTPATGAPYVSTDVITQFQTTADDDPLSVVVVPAGFDGTVVDPGDLLILDRGADSNPPNAIYLYRPSAPSGDPAAYSVFFVTPGDLSAYNNNDGGELDFSPDGSILYLALSDRIVTIDAEGTVLGELTLTGGPITNIDGMAINPADGRIWLGDDSLDQVWSFDPVTGNGQLEITFTLGGETRLDYNINFPVPSMKFNADGSRLLVTDAAAGGWVWVFDTVRAVGPDYDCDGDVDLVDHRIFEGCLNGPGVPVALPACQGVDLDADNDLDLVDFAIFQECFSGEGIMADPLCDD